MLNYLRKHLTVLQSINNNYGLKTIKTNLRKTAESPNVELAAETDCFQDPFCAQDSFGIAQSEIEHVFKAKDSHRKQLIDRGRASPSGRQITGP